MKKIGIMSMQRIKNYGSFWQAYGLKKILKDNIDCSVDFIDYRPGEPIHEEKNEIEFNASFSKKNSIFRKMYGAYFKFKYNGVWTRKYLELTKNHNYSNNYDLTIIGSDEVFNCTQTGSTVGFSKDLFGYERKNVISYAASFGFTTLERLKRFNIDNEVSTLLKDFNAISVRDQNSFNIVNELTGNKPIINLDPALVSDINKLELPKINKKDYIIVYAYTGRISENEKKEIISFARANNKKIISLGYYHDFVDRVIVCNPFKVLAYIKSADYVITDTFHGTIFSVLFQKKFVSLIRKSNEQKLMDLLNRLGLEERKLDDILKLESNINKNIDYESVNRIIDNEKNRTISYLKDNIKGE